MKAKHLSDAHLHAKPYLALGLMVVVHFMVMYALMYSMVDVYENIYPNLNQLYMAGTMTAPMVVLELLLMGKMYDDTRLNAGLFAASAIVLAAFFLFIRNQTGIDDRQFLKSMIPHHAGAILMCEQAPIEDAEIAELCGTIVTGQQDEIDRMKDILARLER